MAFGAVLDSVSVRSSSYVTSITLTLSGTPATSADDALVCTHFTGDGTAGIPTGFTNGVRVTNSTETDDCRISYQIATGSGDDNAVPTSPSADTHMAHLYLITGAFDASPLDITDTEERHTSSPTNTTGLKTTAQADSVLIAIMALRFSGSQSSQTAAWTRQGTATPTSDMGDALSIGENADNAKHVSAAVQTLTAIGTVDFSKAWTGSANVGLGGYIVLKKQAVAGGSLPPKRRMNTLLRM